MKSIFRSMSDFSQRVSNYYSDAKDEIAQINLTSLKFCCLAGMIFCAFFCLVAPEIIDDWVITPEYYAAFAVFILFFLVFIVLRRASNLSSTTVEVVCAAFYTACLAVLIGISVFPYPATPQYYLTAFFIFMPVMLIQRPWIPLVTMVVFEVIFLFLAYAYKTPECVQQDVFNTLASMAFAVIVLVMVNRLRISDYNARAELRELSKSDGLTGLLNKVAFEETGKIAFENDQNIEGSALIVIDMDDFKEINDRLGHQAGDELLVGVGLVLKSVFRMTDLIGRFGGDEFCVLMRGVVRREDVERKIISVIEQIGTIRLGDSKMQSSCSIGAAFPIIGQISYEEAFKVADANLYAAKNKGKNDYLISGVTADH